MLRCYLGGLSRTRLWFWPQDHKKKPPQFLALFETDHADITVSSGRPLTTSGQVPTFLKKSTVSLRLVDTSQAKRRG